MWLPVPREWDSQKAVTIASVHPEPHARYVDPEYGNTIFFWDFGKMAEQPAYRVDMSFRLESYDVDVEVDPARVGLYDKTSQEYALYTRSTRTIHITPKIREMAREAIGDETNPYLQAQRIVEFVRKKMHYDILDFERGRGIDCLLAYPATEADTGQEYYEGSCSQYTALTVALCRAAGIPARAVSGYIGCNPLIEPNDVKARYSFETRLSPDGLAATQLFGGLDAHMWGEFFIHNYGWIPTDATFGTMGRLHNRRWIMSKGRDVLLRAGCSAARWGRIWHSVGRSSRRQGRHAVLWGAEHRQDTDDQGHGPAPLSVRRLAEGRQAGSGHESAGEARRGEKRGIAWNLPSS